MAVRRLRLAIYALAVGSLGVYGISSHCCCLTSSGGVNTEWRACWCAWHTARTSSRCLLTRNRYDTASMCCCLTQLANQQQSSFSMLQCRCVGVCGVPVPDRHACACAYLFAHLLVTLHAHVDSDTAEINTALTPAEIKLSCTCST